MSKHKLTRDQYEVLTQKTNAFKTFFESGYATGLDVAWKKEAGKIFTLLTGRIHNTGCSDCIASFLHPLYKALKQYEADQEHLAEPAQIVTEVSVPIEAVLPVEEAEGVEELPATFDAVTIIDTPNPEKKQVVHNESPRKLSNNKRR